MSITADFLVQAVLVATLGTIFLLVGIRTSRADKHAYDAIRRRTGTSKAAALGTIDHNPDADANTIAGMAAGERDGRIVIVRNGKIASDSISAC